MGGYGYTWLYMVIDGYGWLYMVIGGHGYRWLYSGTSLKGHSEIRTPLY